MDCPRCKSLLTNETIKDIHASIEVDVCNSCGGTWFDKGELSRLDKIREPVILELRKIPGKNEQLRALHCPS